MRGLAWVPVLCSAAMCFTGVFKPALNIGEDFWNSSFTGRFSRTWNPGPARLEVAWELIPSVGDPALQGSTVTTDFRILDFSSRLFPREWKGDENFSLVHDLDRLNLRSFPGKFSITAGRQAIFWGVSKTVSPTDFIAPYPYGTIDTEYRAGVDGIRVSYSMGMMSEVETGMVFSEHAEDNGLWLRGRFYALSTDMVVLGAQVRGTSMAGGSLNRSLGGAAVWVEGLYSRHDSREEWWALSSGAERSFFQSRLYGFLEYHHNSAGVSEEALYIPNTESPAYTEGMVYLKAENYAAAGLSYVASPLVTISAGLFLNADDGSARIDLEMERSLSDNTSIRTGIAGATGPEGGEFSKVPFSFHSVYSLYF